MVAMVQQTVGFNWGAAGVSTSVWRGASLRDVLRRCGIMSSKGHALHVSFEGAEDLPGGGGSKYGTSITREWALDPSRDIILAYMQNGERLLSSAAPNPGEGQEEDEERCGGLRQLRAGRLCHLFSHLHRGPPHPEISGLDKAAPRTAHYHLQLEEVVEWICGRVSKSIKFRDRLVLLEPTTSPRPLT